MLGLRTPHGPVDIILEFPLLDPITKVTVEIY